MFSFREFKPIAVLEQVDLFNIILNKITSFIATRYSFSTSSSIFSPLFILRKLAAYTCSFPAMPTILTQIRALVLQAFLGAALEAELILLFEHWQASMAKSIKRKCTKTTDMSSPGCRLHLRWLDGQLEQ